MRGTTILFKSSTYAYKAKKLFWRNGIEATVIKLNRKSAAGCEHGVDIPTENFYSAINILKKFGIEYSVYRGET